MGQHVMPRQGLCPVCCVYWPLCLPSSTTNNKVYSNISYKTIC